MRTLIEHLESLCELKGDEDAAVLWNEIRDDLQASIDATRKFVRKIDRLEEMAAKLSGAAKEMKGGEGAVLTMPLKNALANWGKEFNALYGLFASGREAMYRVAKAVGVSTRRAAKLKRKTPKKAGEMSFLDMISDIERYVGGLNRDIRDAAESGARSLRVADQMIARKSPWKDRQQLVDHVSAFVSEWLNFRDKAGGAFFAAIKGIQKRADELGARLVLGKFRHAIGEWLAENLAWLAKDDDLAWLVEELR